MDLKLVRPIQRYSDQVMKYREEMLANEDSFDGCAGLEDVSSFDEWIDFDARLQKKYGKGYVPSDVFLAVRTNDDKVVGIIDYRHPLMRCRSSSTGIIITCNSVRRLKPT